VPDFTRSNHRLALIIVIVFVVFSSTVLAIFALKSYGELPGAYLGGFGIAIVIVAAMIYYKVSGKPPPSSAESA